MNNISTKKTIVITYIGSILLIYFLPKILAWSLRGMGLAVSSDNLITKYLFGITVRAIGLLIFAIMIAHSSQRNFNRRIDVKTIAFCIPFFIYIIANIEVPDLKYVTPLALGLMILESIAIGFFE